MFKNASFFKIALPQPFWLPNIIQAASSSAFLPCGRTQERSVGWVPPRGHEHGAMAENIGGQIIMCLMIETKAVPARAVKDAVDDRIKKYKAETGQERVGAKIKKAFKEEVLIDLLPKAFPKRAAVWVWIDLAADVLVIDSASYSCCDVVVTQLVELQQGIKVEPVRWNVSPASLMTGWLHDLNALTTDDRFGFSIGRACELKTPDDSKSMVRYQNHILEIDEVKQHINQGKVATKLALTHLDRVDFTLTDSGALTGIKVLDVALEERFPAGDKDSLDHFDADVVIMTGELKPLIENLCHALDVPEGGAA